MTDINKTNHGQLPLFEIIFTDNSIFKGNASHFDTGWLNIPIKKPIRRVFYLLPSGDYLCLSGYDKYFHMIEATSDLNGKNKGKTMLRFAYIMCLKDEQVRSYRITLDNTVKLNVSALKSLRDNKYKPCDITTRIFNINDDKMKKLNQDIWRG